MGDRISGVRLSTSVATAFTEGGTTTATGAPIAPTTKAGAPGCTLEVEIQQSQPQTAGGGQ